MNMTQAQVWIAELQTAIADNKITFAAACAEVSAEMAEGDHDTEVESYLYDFTRS